MVKRLLNHKPLLSLPALIYSGFMLNSNLPWVIAHRGGPDSAQAPENSLEAINHAASLGVDAIEIDVWQLDGRLYVYHDRTLRDLSPEQRRHYTLDNGEGLPTLSEVLNATRERCVLNIEIKGLDCAQKVAETLESFVRDTQGSFEAYCFSSFDHRQLMQLKQSLPAVRRGVLIEGIPLSLNSCLEIGAWSLNTGMTFCQPELLAEAKKLGLYNLVYTANSADEWQTLMQLPVDGFFTDRPEACINWRATLAKT